jgi:hypothetical protein
MGQVQVTPQNAAKQLKKHCPSIKNSLDKYYYLQKSYPYEPYYDVTCQDGEIRYMVSYDALYSEFDIYNLDKPKDMSLEYEYVRAWQHLEWLFHASDEQRLHIVGLVSNDLVVNFMVDTDDNNNHIIVVDGTRCKRSVENTFDVTKQNYWVARSERRALQQDDEMYYK